MATDRLVALGPVRRRTRATSIFSVTLSDVRDRRRTLAEPPLGAAIRGEPSSVVDAHIRLFCRVGGVAKAPVMAAVQPVIKHERQGRGRQAGPVRGIVYGARLEIEQLAAAMRAGVVR